ncbi:MAG TPA: FAD-dependent oxidoreductase, partial [Anaeromyxobacter sp.]|nr:FAD-dependent oxidoreductase [Anaeromyxobacter sp.]
MLHYDVVVIGSGPAGENGAITAASCGKKVALVEKEAVPGGASANTGTIPSKALRETALAIQQAQSRDAHGIELRVSGTVTIPELMGRRGLVTGREHSRIREALNRAGVEQFRGTASFSDPHIIRVKIPGGGSQELHADVILLATGSRPLHPPAYTIDNAYVYDSDSILMLDRVPRSLAILGGGVAGCEYASLFAALGVNVSMIDSKDRLLPWLDAELSHGMQDLFAMAGIDLHQRVRAQKLEPGERDVLDTLADGSRLVAEKVLVAAGRVGNVESLKLEAAGLSATERGLLEVNAHYQTAVPH